MHSHDRPTSTLLISHNFTQENGCGASMKCRPVMVAKAANAFLTMWIPRRALCFSDYKSTHTWGETSPLGWCHVKCLSPQGKKSVSEKTLHTFTAQCHTFMTDNNTVNEYSDRTKMCTLSKIKKNNNDSTHCVLCDDKYTVISLWQHMYINTSYYCLKVPWHENFTFLTLMCVPSAYLWSPSG